MKQILFVALMMAILGMSAGCGDSSKTGPKGMNNLSSAVDPAKDLPKPGQIPVK